jgi:hypothetical protein
MPAAYFVPYFYCIDFSVSVRHSSLQRSLFPSAFSRFGTTGARTEIEWLRPALPTL